VSDPDQPLPSRRSLRSAAPDQAVALEPVALEPVASEPVASEPVASEPVASEPAAADATAPAPDHLAAVGALFAAEDDDRTRDAQPVTGTGAETPRSTRAKRRQRLSHEPPREKKSRRGTWGCLSVLVVLLGLMAVGAFALQGPLTQLINATQGPADYTAEEAAEGEPIVAMIYEGDSGADIARTLLDDDVVKSFDAFYDALLMMSPEPIFQPGAYQLATKLSGSAALSAILNDANRLELTIVVPEGTAAVDVLQIISEGTEIPLADLQAAAADVTPYGLPAEATTLEGFLFPATYTFAPGVTAVDAITTLVNRQFEALDSAGVAVEERWSTIVLASLIQREAGLREDFYKVSRVFLNRLEPTLWDSGLLQSDATVAYGTGNTHLVTTTDAERADAGNAYNTYVHPGMVVGPISNPGDLAIDAALNPAAGDWLFFVTVNLDSGETVFSNTVDEHDAAVVVWQDWMRENRPVA
jgi:UPF0755 protein